MALPEPPSQAPAPHVVPKDDRAARLLGLRLLTVTAAVAALVFSILLAGTGEPPRSDWVPATAAAASPVPEALGTIAINELPADDLAEQLPGIGPVYAARIVHARTFFGPLRSAADLRALDIPDATVERVLPLLSFRAQGRPGISSRA